MRELIRHRCPKFSFDYCYCVGSLCRCRVNTSSTAWSIRSHLAIAAGAAGRNDAARIDGSPRLIGSTCIIVLFNTTNRTRLHLGALVLHHWQNPENPGVSD